MISTSFIIPTEELTLTAMANFREGAKQAAVARAVTLRVAPTANQVTVRGPQPTLDFGATNDFWETAALAARGTAYSVFNGAVAPTLAANKLCVFYKVGIASAPVNVSRLTFRSGGATGNIIYEFDLEQLINAQSTEGYFSEPVVLDPTTPFAAQVLCRVASGVLELVELGGYIVEPRGQTIS